MSTSQPAQPKRREIEILRVLFDRHLKDRAIALADSRWPGSGKMVDLAYEWSDLSPADRRTRLSSIGPEEIARLREFAALNPELSNAIDELDRRGVLPPIEAAVIDAATATREADQATTAGGQPAGAQEFEQATSATSDLEVASDSDSGAATTTGSSPDLAGESSEEARSDPQPVAAEPDLNTLHVDMPELNIGLPTTSEFLDSEQVRRREALQSSQEAMERVRQRLDQSTQRAFERGSAFSSPRVTAFDRTDYQSLTEGGSDVLAQTRALEAPRSLLRELEARRVVLVRPGDPQPSDDELVNLANELQLGFSEHRLTFENRKQEYGSLVAEYGNVRVRAGRLSRAVAEPNLVVIRGRLQPRLVDRIEEGFMDIPGTRASIKVHPSTRIIILSG